MSSDTTSPVVTDALVIGAGPVGLFQIFELGLQEIHAHVVDVLPEAGGQCMALYPDKPIYDIPGLPASTGRDLTQRLLQQTAPFQPQFHFKQHISGMQAQPDGRWLATTDQGMSFLTKTVFIAAGVGAFVPRSLPLPELQALESTQVFYTLEEASSAHGQHLVVVGGDDLAIQAALAALTHSPASVTVVHRRSTLDASPEWLQAFDQAVAVEKIAFFTAQISQTELTNQRLSGLKLELTDGSSRVLACDQLWVMLGLSPQLGPLANWGLDMSRKQLAVNTENFSTSAAGIFAVGDINTYPGKRKLIVSGFHEATLAAFGAAAYLRPGQKIPLEYTTASPRLHRLLGV
jgi:thioredoxin reductase (NADPH)